MAVAGEDRRHRGAVFPSDVGDTPSAPVMD
jgi:hypothetical protein